MNSKRLSIDTSRPPPHSVRDFLAANEVEAFIGSIILKKLKEKKISLRLAGERMVPPVSAPSLHKALHGSASFGLARLLQLAKILDEDPTQLINEALGKAPEVDYAYTLEQEEFICSDPLYYKMTVACFVRRTSIPESEFCALFSEYSSLVPKALEKLIKKGILTKDDKGSYTSISNKISKFHFTPQYTELLKKLAGEFHETAVAISERRQHLAKYVATKFHLAYLTPEQILFVREHIMELQAQIQKFHHYNERNSEHFELAKNNLMGLMTFFCPLNAANFNKNPVL